MAKATTRTSKKKAAVSSTALTRFLGAAKKIKLDENVVALDGSSEVDFISTGSMMLNYGIGGEGTGGGKPCLGVPRGKITEIYGPESSGKTTVALMTAAECIKEGGTVLFLDYEHSIDPLYAQKLGIPITDNSRFVLMQPITMEEGLKAQFLAISAGVDLLVLDSIGAQVVAAELEKKLTDEARVGALAKKMSEFLPKLRGHMTKTGHKTAVFYIGQTRAIIGGFGHGPKDQAVGGKALKFYADLRIRVQRIKSEKRKVLNRLTGKTEDQPFGNVTKFQIIKSKVSPRQGFQGTFFIRYGIGIDDIRAVQDIAEAQKVIKKAGAFYSFEGPTEELSFRAQGKERVRSYLSKHPKVLDAVRKSVTLTIKVNSGEIDEDLDDAYIVSEDVDLEGMDQLLSDAESAITKEEPKEESSS